MIFSLLVFSIGGMKGGHTAKEFEVRKKRFWERLRKDDRGDKAFPS